MSPDVIYSLGSGVVKKGKSLFIEKGRGASLWK